MLREQGTRKSLSGNRNQVIEWRGDEQKFSKEQRSETYDGKNQTVGSE